MKRKALADFDVQFESLFTVPEATSLFTSYLALSHNEDGFLFAREVRTLKRIIEEKDQVASIIHIVDNYIQTNARFEINVDIYTKQAITHKVQESGQRSTEKLVVPLTIFDNALGVVQRELHEDAFCRFIRSAHLEDYLKKCKDDTFLLSIASKKPEKQDKIKLELEDFYNHAITDADIRKMFRITEDSADWTPLRRTKLGERERQNYAFYRPIKNKDDQTIYVAKATGLLPFCAEHALDICMHFDRRPEWDHIQNRFEQVDYQESSHDRMYSQSCCVYEGNMPFPLKKRVAPVTGSLLYDNIRQCYFWVAKSTYPFTHPMVSNMVNNQCHVIMDLWIFVQFYKVSEHSCRYVYMGITDMHMQFNSITLLKRILKKHFKDMHKTWLSMGESIRQKYKTERPKQHNQMYDTLADFRKKFPEGKSWTDIGYNTY
jgi:hypothetical protein